MNTIQRLISETAPAPTQSAEIEFPPAEYAARETALQRAAVVAVVRNSADNAAAFAVLTEIKACGDRVEKAREAAKRPYIDIGRKIEAFAKDFRAQLDQEYARISRLTADWAILEQRKKAAEELKQRQDLLEIERRREAEIAKAPTLDAVTAAHERAAEEVRMIAPPREIKPAEGQSFVPDWDFEVTDALALAKAFPHLVKIEVRRLEMKAHLKATKKAPPGVRAWEIVKTRVGGKAVEV